MTRRSAKHALVAASAFLMIPAAASAQSNITEQAQEVTQQAQEVQQQADDLANSQDTQYTAREERDGFDWGLLGLLGLAGLLGLRKKDDHDARDIHVDARNNTRT